MTRAGRTSHRKSSRRMARFPRLRQIRAELLGWEIMDIVARLRDRRPSISSVYRLECGLAIRVASARRVFDVVNAALGHTLDPGKELEIE